ncbi:MAG TPA: PKD domain-containing protein [Thermoplasmata archaeon]|nr:PKD domain-containing protein [Thermoplasmata archaeon]
MGLLILAVLLVLMISSIPGARTGSPSGSRAPRGAFAPTTRTVATPPPPVSNWAHLPGGGGPAARWYSRMAYDAADQVVLMAGAYNGMVGINDTWTFANGTWTNLTSRLTTAPPGLDTVAYDPGLGAVVGYGTGAGISVVWEFHRLHWTNITPATNPSPRGRSMMIYDPTLGGEVLFGGQANGGTNTFNDTWLFKNGVWTQLFPAHSPPARARAGFAWDAADSTAVLFGGFSMYGNPDFGDTWEFTGTDWTKTTQSTAPSQRDGIPMVYDPNDRAVILFGGFFTDNFSTQGTDNDTWTYAGHHWTLLSPSVSPSARGLVGLTYCDACHYLLLFGGYQFGNLPLSDAWVWLEPIVSGAIYQTPPAVEVGSLATFNASWTGGGGPFRLNWSFGDGAFSSLESPSHRYAQVASFLVNLTIMDSYGSSRLVQANVTVSVGLSLGAPTYRPIEPVAGAPVGFNLTVSGGIAPYTYSWSFGDGQGSSSASPTHVYASAGERTTYANVSDTDGLRASRLILVDVAATALTAAPPVPNVPAPQVNGSVVLTEAASGGLTPYNYTWDLGDHTTAYGERVTHVYRSAESFVVVVSVRDRLGIVENGTLTLTIHSTSPGGGGGGGGGGSSGSSPPPPYLFWGLVAAIVVVAAAAVAGIALRGRRPPTG